MSVSISSASPVPIHRSESEAPSRITYITTLAPSGNSTPSAASNFTFTSPSTSAASSSLASCSAVSSSSSSTPTSNSASSSPSSSSSSSRSLSVSSPFSSSSHHSILYEGYLSKQVKKSLIGRFHKRWFVLELIRTPERGGGGSGGGEGGAGINERKVLSYFRNEKKEKLIACIDLNVISNLTLVSDKEGTFSFQAFGIPYLLKTEPPQHRQWMQLLSENNSLHRAALSPSDMNGVVNEAGEAKESEKERKVKAEEEQDEQSQREKFVDGITDPLSMTSHTSEVSSTSSSSPSLRPRPSTSSTTFPSLSRLASTSTSSTSPSAGFTLRYETELDSIQRADQLYQMNLVQQTVGQHGDLVYTNETIVEKQILFESPLLKASSKSVLGLTPYQTRYFQLVKLILADTRQVFRLEYRKTPWNGMREIENSQSSLLSPGLMSPGLMSPGVSPSISFSSFIPSTPPPPSSSSSASSSSSSPSSSSTTLASSNSSSSTKYISLDSIRGITLLNERQGLFSLSIWGRTYKLKVPRSLNRRKIVNQWVSLLSLYISPARKMEAAKVNEEIIKVWEREKEKTPSEIYRRLERKGGEEDGGEGEGEESDEEEEEEEEEEEIVVSNPIKSAIGERRNKPTPITTSSLASTSTSSSSRSILTPSSQSRLRKKAATVRFADSPTSASISYPAASSLTATTTKNGGGMTSDKEPPPSWATSLRIHRIFAGLFLFFIAMAIFSKLDLIK